MGLCVKTFCMYFCLITVFANGLPTSKKCDDCINVLTAFNAFLQSQDPLTNDVPTLCAHAPVEMQETCRKLTVFGGLLHPASKQLNVQRMCILAEQCSSDTIKLEEDDKVVDNEIPADLGYDMGEQDADERESSVSSDAKDDIFIEGDSHDESDEKEEVGMGEALIYSRGHDTSEEVLCSLCKDVMAEIQTFLKSKHNQEELLNTLKMICELLPEGKQECLTLVDSVGSLLIDLAVSTLKPELCTTLSLCP